MAAAKKRNDSRKNDPLDTPVMRQYLELKERYPDTILFFRMGDFYELFLEDAKTAAPLMDVALTARQGGVPMAGVPYHSADTYLSRLLQAGLKVAVAEQQEDPENPKLMNRVVRRILSAGTLVEDNLIKSGEHNYLMAITLSGDRAGAAFADVSTGRFFSFEYDRKSEDQPGQGNLESRSQASDGAASYLRDLYARYNPTEIICSVEDRQIVASLLPRAGKALTPLEEWKASPIEGRRRLQAARAGDLYGLGYGDEPGPALGAVSLVYHYIHDSFQGEQVHLDPPALQKTGKERMDLDEHTIRNLDLIYNQQEGSAERTLFRVLDRSLTRGGKRRLKEEILSPLLDRVAIEQRQNVIQFLLDQSTLREALKECLRGVHDIERMLGRASTGRPAPRDLEALRSTISSAVQILNELHSSNPPEQLSESIVVEQSAKDLLAKIQAQIEQELPATIGGGPMVREGVSEDLDKARKANRRGEKWILEFEQDQRNKTGISTLKVKYNRVAGYFVEVSKGQADRVPEDYVRRQTLVGSERYSCQSLQELEDTILGAEKTIQDEEERIFREIMDQALEIQAALRRIVRGTSYIDFCISLVEAAQRGRWVRPRLQEVGPMQILGGKHPVVEHYLPVGERFTPNDLLLDQEESRFAIITGPNMAGKSTYIRQVALIQILAQMGSWVPATEASISVVDQVFTRIGAGDNLTRGESTFYVEMLETARILNRCTERSLVIMDEVGRGTSTFDGLSIAWAVVEYLTESERSPWALFATHYHELTALAGRSGIFNLTIDVREENGSIIFLHRVRPGSADRSYGVHVASLAGLPTSVIERAGEKLAELEDEMVRLQEKNRSRKQSGRKQIGRPEDQPGLF